MEEEDLYAVLGIQGGDSSRVLQLDVRKAYRSLALVWHPDKQAGKKAADIAAAAVEFDKIRKAHEILGDEKARKAYDELRNLRKSRLEKELQFSAKRQKMMQDLRDRERAFETERADKREEEMAANRLKAEISRIRASHSKNRANAKGVDFSPISQIRKSTNPVTAPATPAQAVEMEATLNNTLKVSWTCTDGGAGGYTASRLKTIFEEFGVVVDIVIRESKSRRKGSALVVMSSEKEAISAVGVPCGDFSNPLLAAPVLHTPSKQPGPAVSSQTAPGGVDGLVHVVGSGYQSYEEEILAKMRSRAEMLAKKQRAEDNREQE